MNNIIVQKTEDGSHTLYNQELDETYHSKHGAIQEANHVFILNGIQGLDAKEVSILEVGFGTGLNAILTYAFAKKNRVQIDYTGIESSPLSEDIIDQLNYKNEIKDFDLAIFNTMHSCNWNTNCKIDSHFSLIKSNIALQEYDTSKKFDVIYYDAFGPRAQKEMWEKSLFQKLYDMLNIGGKLVTYCAMGQFKRDLKFCGFVVNSVPGPPGKREMTVAYKK